MEMTIKRRDLGYTLAIDGRPAMFYGTRAALQHAIESALTRVLDKLD